MAYYSGCCSSHSSDCFDFSGYLSNHGLDSDSDSDSGTCFGRYYLHTAPNVVCLTNSHTVLALLSSTSADNP